MDGLSNNISRFLDGEGTPYYEPVIKSIRDLLPSIDELVQSKGGAIIFFEKVSEDGDLMMQVFPFRKNTCILEENGTGILLEEKEALFKEINQPKPYKDFWHCAQFKKHHDSDEHCSTRVPPENILTYTSRTVTVPLKDPVTGKIGSRTMSWSEFCTGVACAEIDKNTYEQVLLESGCKGVSFVPIPVLSTPSILLVLNKKYFESSKNDLLKSLYFRSRDTVDSYLYSRLLDSLSSHLQVLGEQWDEKQLVEAFVKEICNIILPISYQINDGPVVDYYPSWPANGFKSTYRLHLLDGAYNVVFNLTSFHYVDLDRSHSESTDWDWIHESQIYKSNCHQSSLLICKLFQMMHTNWTLIRSAEKRAYDRVALAMSSIDINGLKLLVENIDQKFQELNKRKEELTGFAPTDQLSIIDGQISLIVDGEQLLAPVDFDPKNVGQKSGFIYLHYILSQSKLNNNKCRVSCEDLYKNVLVPKIGKVDPDIAQKKTAALSAIKEGATAILKDILEFYKRHKVEIINCTRDNTISDKPAFNKDFYFVSKLLAEFSNNQLHTFVKLSSKFEVANELRALLKIYQKLEPEITAAQLKSQNIGAHFTEIKAAKLILRKNDEGGNPQQFVRECFQAMVKKLRGTQKHLNGSKHAAMEHLLINLENSGLINPGKNEPLSQTSYTYDQNNKDSFINWYIELGTSAA